MKVCWHRILSILIICMMILGMAGFEPVSSATAETAEAAYDPDSLIVTFAGQSSTKKIISAINDLNVQVEEMLQEEENIALVSLDGSQTVEEAVEDLNKLPQVAAVQPNYYYYTDEADGDDCSSPLENSQWNLDYMDVWEAWNLIDKVKPAEQRQDDDKIIVATLDTGVTTQHPDIQENLDKDNCINVVDEEYPYSKYTTTVSTHGTGTAGIIAATSHNGIGMAGVAAGNNNDLIQLMAINVFRPKNYTGQGCASTADIIKGLDYACEKGASVINMCLGHTAGAEDSIGEPHYDDALEAAVNHAVYDLDVVITCSAGNHGDSRVWYPSDFDAVISVINTVQYDDAWSISAKNKNSSYGSKKDISAPGTLVYTLKKGDGYRLASGTSLAAPSAAGVAALVRYVNPQLSQSQVKEVLYSTATDLYTTGYDIFTGYGNINAYKAVAKAAGVTPEETPEKLAATSKITAKSAGKTSIEISWSAVKQANGYYIYRSDTEDGEYKKVGTVSGKTKFTNRNCVHNKLYYYKVKAYGTSIDGKKVTDAEWSTAASSRATIAIPKLKLKNNTFNSIKVTWNKSADAEGYRIYRATSKDGEYKSVKLITKGSTTGWTDRNCKAGKKYYYKIRAYCSSNGSRVYTEYSSAASKETKAAAPKLKVSRKGSSAKLTWNKDSTATGYKIYQKKGSSGTWKLVKTVKGKNSWTSKALKKNTRYYYKICAYKKIGSKNVCSEYSKTRQIRRK